MAQAEDLVCVPDVSGLSVVQAASLLRQRGLETEISGDGYAVRQNPAANDFAAPGTVVTVTFELPNP